MAGLFETEWRMTRRTGMEKEKVGSDNSWLSIGPIDREAMVSSGPVRELWDKKK